MLPVPRPQEIALEQLYFASVAEQLGSEEALPAGSSSAEHDHAVQSLFFPAGSRSRPERAAQMSIQAVSYFSPLSVWLLTCLIFCYYPISSTLKRWIILQSLLVLVGTEVLLCTILLGEFTFTSAATSQDGVIFLLLALSQLPISLHLCRSAFPSGVNAVEKCFRPSCTILRVTATKQSLVARLWVLRPLLPRASSVTPVRHLEMSASTHSISNVVLSALTALPEAPAGTNLQIL